MKHRPTLRLPALAAFAACAVLLVQACAGAGLEAGADRGDSARAPALQSMVAAARQDAAQATGIAADRWRVVRAEPVTWSDGALGCPLPGRLYTQALVRGFRVQIAAAGQQRDYHAGASGQPSFCPADRVRPPLPARAAV